MYLSKRIYSNLKDRREIEKNLLLSLMRLFVRKWVYSDAFNDFRPHVLLFLVASWESRTRSAKTNALTLSKRGRLSTTGRVKTAPNKNPDLVRHIKNAKNYCVAGVFILIDWCSSLKYSFLLRARLHLWCFSMLPTCCMKIHTNTAPHTFTLRLTTASLD